MEIITQRRDNGVEGEAAHEPIRNLCSTNTFFNGFLAFDSVPVSSGRFDRQ
jgi:hypothetical protein